MIEAKQLARLLFAILSIVLCLGCKKGGGGSEDAASSGGPPKPIKLAFVTNNASPFWKIAEAGLRKYEKEAGVQVDMKMPPGGTPEDQNRILRSLSADGYDAIAVSVIAPKDQLSVLDEVATKTSLITFDSDADQSKRLLYIGTNNFAAGKALGERISQLVPEGSKLAVFVGSLTTANASQRLAGLESALEPHRLQIVEKREDNTDRSKARSNVEEVISKRKDVSLVVGLWNYNGPAIAAAIEGLGKQGQVRAAVFDEDEATLDAIQRGTIAATVVQKPFQFGYLSAKWLHGLATSKESTKKAIPPGGVIDTGVSLIDKGNVGAFRAELEAMRRSVQ